VDPIGKQNRGANTTDSQPIRTLTDERLDFAGPVPLFRSYIVASSDRASSAYLSKSLWETGRCGAPLDYLNASFEDLRGTLARPVDRSVASMMMKRLQTPIPIDYIARLLKCRTSANGVFGSKARFDDFESALEEFPDLLTALAPVTYVYVEHRDKVAQAAAVVRGLLSSKRAGVPPAPPGGRTLHYSRELISRSLGRLERQRLGWLRWFEANGIEPFVVYHEDAVDSVEDVVRNVMKLLGVQNDVAAEVTLPPLKPGHDEQTAEWAARFAREIDSGIDIAEPESVAGRFKAIIADFEPAAKVGETADLNAFRTEVESREDQRFHPPGLDFRASAGSIGEPYHAPHSYTYQPAAEFQQAPQYEQLIGRNRDLLQGAGVLDLMSDDGLCSLAALGAGAGFVVGVDPRRNCVATAERGLASYGAPESSYRFVHMGIGAALADTAPETFDVIVARGIFERIDARRFFAEMRRLRPKHVILETKLTYGKRPLMRFSWREAQTEFPTEAHDQYTIVTTPNHEFIVLLCDFFGFRWRLSEGESGAPGSARWGAGREWVQTYVLDRIT
jgi:LPS sulfotransferase NodH